MDGEFPAKSTVYTPYIVYTYVWLWPTLCICNTERKHRDSVMCQCSFIRRYRQRVPYMCSIVRGSIQASVHVHYCERGSTQASVHVQYWEKKHTDFRYACICNIGRKHRQLVRQLHTCTRKTKRGSTTGMSLLCT